jgi:replicative DNA helicase
MLNGATDHSRSGSDFVRGAGGSVRVAPHDLHAEAAVLSAMLLEETAVDEVSPLLKPGQFYSEANRWVCEAVYDLRACGKAPDVVSVAGWLRDKGRLAQCGGSAYLAGLVDCVPAVARVGDYAQTVAAKAQLRKAIATYQRIVAEGYGDVGDVQEFLHDAEREIAELSHAAGTGRAITPAQRALALCTGGVRIPLGFETLDRACRGGPLAGRVVIVGGAPGAGKTTLVTQIGIDLARRGVAVAIVAADEAADGLLIRVGQNENLDREDLEAGNEQACRELADRLAPLSLALFEGDDNGITIEEASTALAKIAHGGPSVLIVDSVQTARSAGTAEAEGARARANVVMAALKRAARQHGHLVIATSEVSRGWYRNSKDRIDPLAAFKESGGIEYGAGLALAMINVKGQEDLVDVVIAKNRMGQKPPFRLRLNFARARFQEVPIEVDDDIAADEDQREAVRLDKARGRILATLAKVTTLTTKTAVCIRARGNKKENLKAFDELVLEGLVVEVAGVFRTCPSSAKGSADV